MPSDVAKFLVAYEGFELRTARELWARLSEKERAGLHTGAAAWKAFVETYPLYSSALETHEEVRLCRKHLLANPAMWDPDEHPKLHDARAALDWRKRHVASRDKFQALCLEWYRDEFQKRGGARRYHKPLWMRFMLALGFSEHITPRCGPNLRGNFELNGV